MKKLFLSFLFLGILLQTITAQFNSTLVGHLGYNAELTDVWGYVAPNGTEYALVGVQTGVSIVSLADPSMPMEVAFIEGDFSRWRDLKTFGTYAYIVADEPSSTEGLTVIDLSELPAKVSKTNWQPMLNNSALRRCHNLYIDENGVAYLSGCNVNGGGMIFVDVASAPGDPALIGFGPSIYSHDVFVANNRMYASELNNGRLAIYDVSNLQDVKLRATQQTPFSFTHNAWATENGNTVFTTDEKGNAPVAAYDISDLNDIKKLDEFRPAYSIGSGLIPHNVHVKDNYLLISNYTAGGVFVDASRPDNLVEIANYDTSPSNGGGFSGAWGLYPFLPSGNILISDIEEGLFIVKPDLKRACFLEGKITDISNNQALIDAEITILTDQTNFASSDLLGQYKTGIANAGTFDVKITKLGYEPKTVPATLVNGQVTILNVALTPLARFNVGGKAVSSLTGNAVPNASVVAYNENYRYETTANNSGNFSFEGIFADQYDIVVGSWGYLHKLVENVTIDNDKAITVALDDGYQDDFIFDQGWQSLTDSATAGYWERGVPLGATFSGVFATPAQDIPTDIGDACYVTGNGSSSAGNHDVDNGAVLLISPTMDLTSYQEPIISYYLWFFNNGGNGSPDDELTVLLSNGNDTITLETVSESRSAWREPSVFAIKDLIELTNNMTIIFQTEDLPDNAHIVKAAVDAFLVSDDATTTSVDGFTEPFFRIEAFPNPFSSYMTISYQLLQSPDQNILEVYSLTGQLVERSMIPGTSGTIRFGENLSDGVYLVRMRANGAVSETLKVVKTR